MPILTDKEQKKQFKLEASKNPDKYYPAKVLKEMGFIRKQCKCKTFFWTTNEHQLVCGDVSCQGKFTYQNIKVKEKLDFFQVWHKFKTEFEKKGYKPLNRYPVVARWNPDMDFTIASIAAFQPHVTSGLMKPPAEYITIDQFCLRFGDVDNVGITGSHMTGFFMIGQKCFTTPERWDQEKVFRDICDWIFNIYGIRKEDVTFHEEAWAGGGNFGPCIEWFSGGVELGNQVYMMFEQMEEGSKELKLKILDMGMGHERHAWFSMKTPTSYDAAFPSVLDKLRKSLNVNFNKKLMSEFVPYAGMLNVDEVEDVSIVWQNIADRLKVTADELKKNVLSSAAVYSIAEHTRALLFALNDGALPSNVGGGYNLRILIRRCLSFIDQYKWDLHLSDVCRWHAEYLKPLFPELMENLDLIEDILEVEKEKYESTKQKSEQIVKSLLEKSDKISVEKLIELYDSNGISPELIKEAAEKIGKKITVPDNFYGLVSERHIKKEQAHETHKEHNVDFGEIKGTDALYFKDYHITKFKAKVVAIKNNFVVLDNTFFYPTSGGQLHDTGRINGEKVIDVFKDGERVVCVMEEEPKTFKIGSEVGCEVDWDRRLQLAQHHTATHIVNAAARKVLGNHINQAGAKKTLEKAQIDITHYRSLTQEDLDKIENEANKIINLKIQTRLSFMPRDEAEAEFGKNIYQGGVAPGSLLRIVEIPGIDAEACGGTHLNNTSEAVKIKILKSTKIQDGIVRLYFVAGKKAEEEIMSETGVLEEVCKFLNVKEKQIPKRAEELFDKWKKAKKAVEKRKTKEEFLKENKEAFSLVSKEEFDGDSKAILEETSKILKTQPENILKTLKRFKEELNEMEKRVG